MELFVGEKFKITSDRFQYIVEQKKVKTEGENIGDEYWVTAGYYSMFDESLFLFLVNHGMRTSELVGVRQILDYLTQMKKDIMKLDFRKAVKKLKQESEQVDNADDIGDMLS